MRSALALLVAAALAAPAAAQPVTYDIVEGLFKNTTTGPNGQPATQQGIDHWWFKYDPVAPWGGWQGIPIDAGGADRDPANFQLMELGYTNPHGWAADLGASIGDRGIFRRGGWDTRMMQGGSGQGDAVWGNAENEVQLVAEWSAPEDGVADVSYLLAGRDHDNTDLQWHLAKWVWDDVAAQMELTDLGFALVTQEDTPQSPEELAAQGIDLRAGDSIFLYGYVWDHDAYDGTVIQGGITFTPAAQDGDLIPEPATLSLLALGALGLLARRRRP